MNVTRDVIHDLLPAYFAGDASEDSRRLVDEFFAVDPEFGRMARRFGALMNERQSDAVLEEDRAKVVFDRARGRVKLKMASAIWGIGALFPFAMALFAGPFSVRHPGVVIGLVFAAMAVATWLMAMSPRPEWWYAAFTGDETAPTRRADAPGR